MPKKRVTKVPPSPTCISTKALLVCVTVPRAWTAANVVLAPSRAKMVAVAEGHDDAAGVEKRDGGGEGEAQEADEEDGG
jgi:hypothetical protein